MSWCESVLKIYPSDELLGMQLLEETETSLRPDMLKHLLLLIGEVLQQEDLGGTL